MSRLVRILPWALAALAIALHLVGHLFVVLGIGTDTPADEETTLGAVGFVVAFYTFPLVGAVIASRRPESAIGWLLLGLGLVLGLTDAASSYADYALYADPGRLPAGEWAAWTVSWLDPFFFLAILLLVLLFPDGRLPSRRWRPVLAGLLVAGLATMATSAIEPGPVFDTSLPVENPAGVEAARPLRDAVAVAASVLFVVTAVLAAAAAVRRFRRATGVERQQFKWFVFATCLLLTSFVLLPLTLFGFPEQLAVGSIGIGFALVGLSIGVAVLRYRLYEIDRVASKALVYGALSVILGAAYVGLVLAAQALFASVTGGGDLAIAVSTLVVAALFLPARARVQRFVDRRFYRRRYDAARTLEAFGARLRDEVELDGLRADLAAAVRETMQPAHVSLWLRAEARP